MKAISILTSLLFATSAIALPPAKGHSCTDTSSKIKKWTVRDFDFHAQYYFSSPSHQNSWGYVNFTLEHAVLNYKSVCTAASSQMYDFFYGTVIYNCSVPVPDDAATFTFSRPNGELKINQTWACAEENSRFWAEGGVTLDLNCREEFWQNPDWQSGEFYSTRDITCDLVTVPAPIEHLSAVA